MFREMRRKKQQLSDEECVEILKKEPRGELRKFAKMCAARSFRPSI